MWHLEATHPGGILGLMPSVSSGKSNRNMIVAIAALLAVWLTVMFYRNEIRGRWRVHKLTDLAATHPDPQMRRQAVRGLGAEGKVTVLRQMVQGDDPVTACAAVEALASIGSDEAVEILIAQIRRADAGEADPALAVRVQAIESLGELQAAEAVEALVECLDDPTLFEGRTAAERSAAGAIEALRPEYTVDWPGARTVAEHAAQALERITGRPWPTS